MILLVRALLEKSIANHCVKISFDPGQRPQRFKISIKAPSHPTIKFDCTFETIALRLLEEKLNFCIRAANKYSYFKCITRCNLIMTANGEP